MHPMRWSAGKRGREHVASGQGLASRAWWWCRLRDRHDQNHCRHLREVV